MPALLAAAVTLRSVFKRRKNLQMTLLEHAGLQGLVVRVNPPPDVRRVRVHSTDKKPVAELNQ